MHAYGGEGEQGGGREREGRRKKEKKEGQQGQAGKNKMNNFPIVSFKAFYGNSMLSVIYILKLYIKSLW